MSQPPTTPLPSSSNQALRSIQEMLDAASSEWPLFPPTLLYNEGWLLRLILAWFAAHPGRAHPLSFMVAARWFSEALLPSAFLPRSRSDKLAESRTHADGVAGHFQIGQEGKADLQLLPDASQFLVLEAKMFSTLSSGVTNAPYFDQAARNVACIAEVLRRANRPPSALTKLGFYVLAPNQQFKKGLFSRALDKKSILNKTQRRVQAYAGEKDEWFERWFQPTLTTIDIRSLNWESVITTIQSQDPAAGDAIDQFYALCLRFNQ